MYRMVNWKDMQNEVTGELIRGFQIALAIPRTAGTIVWTTEQVAMLEEMLSETPFSFEKLDKEQKKGLMAKLGKMYEELFDLNYAYTYDEFGEYLLAVMMNYVNRANMHVSDIDFSEPCLNPLDYPSLYNFLLEEMKELEEEAKVDENARYEIMTEEEMRNEAHKRIRAMFCFPFMASDPEVIEFYSPVFWDMDFVMFNDLSLEEFEQLAKSGFYYEFYPIPPTPAYGREPFSGSYRGPARSADKESASSEIEILALD